MPDDDGRKLYSHMHFLRKRLAAIEVFEFGWDPVRPEGLGIQIRAAEFAPPCCGSRVPLLAMCCAQD